MPVKVKVCGITNLEDARHCIACGADFLGFVFYDKSPRFIPVAKARSIIRRLPSDTKKVGVFVNEPADAVRRTAEACGLDLLQFHGDESPAYANAFKGFKVIKAFRIKDRLDIEKLREYRCGYFLFDAYSKSAYGGTGSSFDWKNLLPLKKEGMRFFVSGGLNCWNVEGLLGIFKPFAVDVSSGVERSAGKKDRQKVKEFIRLVKNEVL